MYELVFSMWESDLFSANALMGTRHIMLTKENGWALGTYRLRSTDITRWGDYEVEFEVRAAPLPDLRPFDIKVYDLPNGTQKRVCAVIKNEGGRDAGPFVYSLFVHGQMRPEANGKATGLADGGQAEICGAATTPIAPGARQILAVVDTLAEVTEYNETNNGYQRAYAATSALPSAADDVGAEPSPASASREAGADLAVSAIRVNGQVPDGKADCKDGKHDISVVVKNGGATETKGATVRLVVDGDGPTAKSLGTLDAGKEREVRFEDVRLKKGTHTLTATLDQQDASDHALTITAVCSAAD